jgi:two-component system, chemotaxis family, sensor kinase CheA
MAVVRNAVQDLGGTLSMHTEAGHGARFSMRLPLTLAIADALLVEAAGQRYALPQTVVREVLPVEKSAVVKLENNEVIPYRGGVLPLIRLRRLFGLAGRPGKRLHVLVLSASGCNVGLAVDRIVGQREIVVRTIADSLLKVPGVTGATELGDGRPILILDAQALIRLHEQQGQRK